MNKGKKYILCPECKRKRYCSRRPLPNDYREWTCSKGHVWSVELSTVERVNKIVESRMIPKLKEMLEHDSLFYSVLKRK